MRFPEACLYDSSREVIVFTATVDDETISCEISVEALCDHFDGDLQKPTQAFLANRRAIERLAEKLISRGRFEPDGSILIRSADC